MDKGFHSDAIMRQGWRQGSLLGSELATQARAVAASELDVRCSDLLIVASHDCDIVNPNLEKEPFVELVGARPGAVTDKVLASGRNPRALQFDADFGEGQVVPCTPHRRWQVRRSLLLPHRPGGCLPDRERRLLALWLAKRYVRSGFPNAFEQRWRTKLRRWYKLLQRHSDQLLGVYLRLNSLHDLDDDDPYLCHLLLTVPHEVRRRIGWTKKRAEIEGDVRVFWDQFRPAIQCAGVEVLGTDEITLADIEPYQRFDADWISFEDDTETMDKLL